MKARMTAILAVVLALLCGAAVAEEMVFISELYEQAQAMGSVWQETFQTPNGEMTVDVPIIVPDVDAMPVLTLEKAKIPEELFNQIAAGKKIGDQDQHDYEIEMNGEPIEFFLGTDNCWIFGEQTNNTGYDAFEFLSVYHGDYRTSLHTGIGSAEKQAQPTTYHYPWEIDADAACVRESNITLNEAMRLWHEDLALCYPDDHFEIQPSVIKLRGSTLTDATGDGKKYKRNGYLVIESVEQLIGGIPLMGSISGNCYVYDGGTTAEKNNIEENQLRAYRLGSYSVNRGGTFYGNFTDENNYRTTSTMARVRTTEYEDVPLVSLDTVLENLQEKIEAGNIREIFSIKLGYLLYSNPDMTDHAWAIPRWEVKADYVMDGMEKDMPYEAYDANDHRAIDGDYMNVEGRCYFANLPVDAQSGELIIFSYGDEKNAEVFSVPEILTWVDVK